AEALQTDQQHDLALLDAEQPQRLVEVAPACTVSRRRGLVDTHALQPDMGGPARLAPQAVYVEIVKNGEQPLARVVAFAPLLQTRQRALQRVLDEVVGLVVVAEKRARIAPQARDFRSNSLPPRPQAAPPPMPTIFVSRR